MRWISSMNSTSPGVRLDSSAARSPACWMAGPLDMRSGRPLSCATIIASVVLPSPGGPDEQDVVGRALLDARGVQQQLQLPAHLLLADELGERRRAQRALDRELGLVDGLAGVDERHPPAGSLRAGPRVAQREPQERRAPRRGRPRGVRRRRTSTASLAARSRPAEPDERLRRPARRHAGRGIRAGAAPRARRARSCRRAGPR